MSKPEGFAAADLECSEYLNLLWAREDMPFGLCMSRKLLLPAGSGVWLPPPPSWVVGGAPLSLGVK